MGAQTVRFEFSNGLRLRYRLNSTPTAAVWRGQLAQMEPAFMARSDTNHRHGFASQAQVAAGVERLYACARFLDIALAPLTPDNWHAVLNQAHAHFPGFFHVPSTRERFEVAHDMNLLIHWLEYELLNLLEGRDQYLFTLDFNHHVPAYQLKQSFANDQFPHFSPALRFGTLHLHYLYIGRHFLEMFDAQDQAAPPDHFQPQHEFNATCSLVFNEPGDPQAQDAAMRQFHQSRGGRDFFGYDYDDPRLAKGFFVLGELEDLASYADPQRRQALRAQLQQAHVAGWSLVD